MNFDSDGRTSSTSTSLATAVERWMTFSTPQADPYRPRQRDMSLKNGIDSNGPRTWSLAGMLTAYYAGSAFLIVLLATGYLYWAMIRSVDLEDDRLLADRVRLLEAILLATTAADMTGGSEQEVNESWQAGQHTQVFIRIADEQGEVSAVRIQGDGRPVADLVLSRCRRQTRYTGANLKIKPPVNPRRGDGRDGEWSPGRSVALADSSRHGP